jgi:hypothetical protein
MRLQDIQNNKIIIQAHYGGYCEMCRSLEEEMVPYHAFTFELYEQIRTKFKSKKILKCKNQN